MDSHVARLILAVLTVGFALGFFAGYGVRASISYYRRTIAQRHRTLIH